MDRKGNVSEGVRTFGKLSGPRCVAISMTLADVNTVSSTTDVGHDAENLVLPG